MLALTLIVALTGCGGGGNDGPAATRPSEPVAAATTSTYTAFSGTTFGSSDASTAIPLDANWMLVGDDESNVLSVYPRHGGAAVAQWDFSKNGPMLDKELDVEASARIKDSIYLLGSHSNKKDGGDAITERGHLFEVKVDGVGSTTQVTYVAKFSQLETQLIAWDRSGLHGLGANYFGFAVSTAAGITPERLDGFSIEGLVASPKDDALWLGFRAPITHGSVRTKALIIPLNNPAALLAGTASQAVFGAPIELDLGGRGIRSIDKDASGGYLIIAGPAGAASPLIDRNFALYGWDGSASSAAREFDNKLDELRKDNGGSFETIVSIDGAVAQGTSIQLLLDNGDSVWPGKTAISKDLPAAEQQFQGLRFTLGAYRNDVQGPLLARSSPADDRVGVPINAQIVLKFNEAIRLGSGSLTLHKADGTAVEVFNAASPAGRVTLANNQVSLVPAQNLEKLASYFITIDGTAISDLKGNAYAGISTAQSLNFVAAGDVTALTVGDLLFVGVNAEATDAIAFVLLKDVSGGTQVTFTDRDYTAAKQFAGVTNEGVFTWTADRNIAAGTIITVQTDSAPLSPIADIGFTVGAPGGIGKEEIIMAMFGSTVSALAEGSAGVITNPGVFLASITLGGLGKSTVPAALVGSEAAIDFSVSPANQTNAIYAGSLDRSDIARFASRVKLKANWNMTQAPVAGFPVVGGSLFAGQ